MTAVTGFAAMRTTDGIFDGSRQSPKFAANYWQARGAVLTVITKPDDFSQPDKPTDLLF